MGPVGVAVVAARSRIGAYRYIRNPPYVHWRKAEALSPRKKRGIPPSRHNALACGYSGVAGSLCMRILSVSKGKATASPSIADSDATTKFTGAKDEDEDDDEEEEALRVAGAGVGVGGGVISQPRSQSCQSTNEMHSHA